MFLNENFMTLSGYAKMKFLDPILQNINKNTGQVNVLEIGCASGSFLEYIDARMSSIQTMTGIDLNSDLIDAAKNRHFQHPCQFIAGDALSVLNENDKFQVIILFDVIEHVADDQLFLERICRHLADDGTLIFSVPAHQWLWSYVDEMVGHYRRYSKTDVMALLRRTGCDKQVVYSMGLLPGMVLPFTASHLKRNKQSLDNHRDRTAESSVNIIPVWYKRVCMTFKYLFPVFYIFDYVMRNTPLGSQFLAVAREKHNGSLGR